MEANNPNKSEKLRLKKLYFDDDFPDREDLARRTAYVFNAVNAHDDLLAACDPDTLEAIANEIESFENSARCESLRLIAKNQRAAIAKAKGA